MPAAGANLNLGLGDLQWNGPGPAPAAQPAPSSGGLNLGLGGGGYNPFEGPVAGSAPNPFNPYPSLTDRQDPLAGGPGLASLDQLQAEMDAKYGFDREAARRRIAPDAQGPSIQRPGGTGAERSAALLDQQMSNIDGQRSGVSRDLDLARTAGQQAVARADVNNEFTKEGVDLGQREAAARKAALETKQAMLKDSPGLWKKDATGFEKFLILGGIALAGYVDAQNAGKGQQSNNAVALITSLMKQNRDMAMQQAGAVEAEVNTEYAAKWEDLKRRQGARLAEMAPGEVRTKAEQSYRAIEKEALQADSEALASATRFAQVEAQREEVTGRINTRASAKRGTGTGSGGSADTNDPYAGMNANQRDIARRKDAAIQVSDLDGAQPLKAKDAPTAHKLNTARAAANKLRDNIQEMRKFVEDEGTLQVPVFEASAIKRRDTITTSMSAALTDLNRTGVLNDKEFERYSAMSRPDWYQSNKGADSAFDQLDRVVGGNYRRELEAGTQGGGGSYQGVGSPQLPTSRAAPGRSLEPGGVTPVTPTSVPQSQAPAPAPGGGQRKQGRDGKWYVKTAYGWSPE